MASRQQVIKIIEADASKKKRERSEAVEKQIAEIDALIAGRRDAVVKKLKAECTKLSRRLGIKFNADASHTITFGDEHSYYAFSIPIQSDKALSRLTENRQTAVKELKAIRDRIDAQAERLIRRVTLHGVDQTVIDAIEAL